ncbi:hypothetical protein EDD85DRAFT_593053 [Armillaria nabsnona]|nr:hypothetical protein EDD85DRAFT_593053 [Armillaria nabsnona]
MPHKFDVRNERLKFVTGQVKQRAVLLNCAPHCFGWQAVPNNTIASRFSVRNHFHFLLVAPFLSHFALLLTRPPTPFCVWVVPGLTQQLLPFTPTLLTLQVSQSPELSAFPASLVVSTFTLDLLKLLDAEFSPPQTQEITDFLFTHLTKIYLIFHSLEHVLLLQLNLASSLYRLGKLTYGFHVYTSAGRRDTICLCSPVAQLTDICRKHLRAFSYYVRCFQRPQ